MIITRARDPIMMRGEVMKSNIMYTVRSGLVYLLSPIIQNRATKLSAILGMITWPIWSSRASLSTLTVLALA